MKAIELISKTDQQGHLKINYHLDKKESDVRVIILYDDPNEIDEETLWLQSISKNPAFDFLKEPNEDIYTKSDGGPLNA
ncbi:MAG: hypothetical protein B6D64_06885 [Bacteroidetes bacterium 4484_276]|nr:MAG: hypothetical protein B6D64_06885 [Bacteroidetes bacterium 4484_276]OYT13290.1 MAG: hypothetical protein B6I19_05910 [Bacteroidetes bacterium 4572_114]